MNRNLESFLSLLATLLLIVLAQYPVNAASSQLSSPQNQSARIPGLGWADNRLPQVSGQIEVALPVEKIWSAIKMRRRSDPAHRQLVSYDGISAVLTEKFPSVPVVGNVLCTYVEKEDFAQKTITYSMLSSDHFRVFEGIWRLAPGSKPGTTVVSLTNTLDPGIRFPLWRRIARAAMNNNLNNNLAEVARLAR